MGYTPGTNSWSATASVTVSGTHGGLATAAASGRATTLSVDSPGSAAAVRAYPVAIP